MNRSLTPSTPLGRWLARLPWLLAAWMLLAAGAAQAQADAPGRVGRLSELQGTVWLFDTADNEWAAAQRNRPIVAGDRLATDPGARAEIQIGSNTLRLDGGTELTMQALDDDRVVAAVSRGTLAVRARSSEVARELQVETPVGRMLPQRAGHYRVDVDERSTVVGAWSGSLRFDAPDSALDVQAGQHAEFWREDGRTHYTWAEAPRDRFSDWVLAQDRADDARMAALGRDISPEMTGVDELGRYGQWDTHPEYGNVWYPSGVAAGWAPYRFGQWAWISPWGWTWVDDAPWGFAPFHYGRWVQVGGRWCWAPGQYVARPAYAPALVAWIGGSNFSVGVNAGGPPYIGWVPLAPREPYVPGWRYPSRHRDGFDPWYGSGRPPSHWRPAERVPHAPLVNERLPGGLTLLPSDGFRQRQSVGNRFVTDPRELREAMERRRGEAFTPPPPARIGTRPDGDRRPNWPDRRRDDNGRTVDTGRPWNDGRRDDRNDRNDDRWRRNDGVVTRPAVPPGGREADTTLPALRNRDGSPGTVVVPRGVERSEQRPDRAFRGGDAPQERADRIERPERPDRIERSDRFERGDAPRGNGNNNANGNGNGGAWPRSEQRGSDLPRGQQAMPAPRVEQRSEPPRMQAPAAAPAPRPEVRIERSEPPRMQPPAAAPAPRIERSEPPRAAPGRDKSGESRGGGPRQQDR